MKTEAPSGPYARSPGRPLVCGGGDRMDLESEGVDVSEGLIIVEGGHFHIKADRWADPDATARYGGRTIWEPVNCGSREMYARVTPGALQTLDAMIIDVRTLRLAGERAEPMILINDLAVPGADRGALHGWWPEAIRVRLDAAGIEPIVIRESEARNLGRQRARELLDDAQSDPRACYAARGYGIVHRSEYDPRIRAQKQVRRLLTDVTAEWAGLPAVTLTHGGTVKCPGILAGVLGRLAAAGATRFRAHYSRDDEPDIIAKLRGGFVLHAIHGPGGLVECEHLIYTGGRSSMRLPYAVDDFRQPGELGFDWLMRTLPDHAPGAGRRGKRRRRGRRTDQARKPGAVEPLAH